MSVIVEHASNLSVKPRVIASAKLALAVIAVLFVMWTTVIGTSMLIGWRSSLGELVSGFVLVVEVLALITHRGIMGWVRAQFRTASGDGH